jgi:hypothetical protein
MKFILELFCTRYYVTFINWSVVTYRYLVYGPFGLKALCSVREFPSIWFADGTVGGYNKSVISSFNDVLKGMNDSRESFESQPDDGFFGKACARIFNLIEVYIFRFIVVGIFIVLIGFTFLILITITFTFMILLTMIIWVTFYMILL